MFDTTELKKNLKVEFEGKLFVVIKSDFTNPGKGSAFVTVKMRNMETGQVIERTFKSGVKTGVTRPNFEEREMEFMYEDADGLNFLDQRNYESINIPIDQVGDAKDYIIEGTKVSILYHNDKAIDINLPNFVELVVSETDPGLKGDTASGGTKKAVMQTGLQVNVPLFIKEGEILKIDTRTGEYVERVNK